jgi:deoxyribodipyrimidine photo-lyase
MAPSKIVIFWFRRDLRLEDNHGLSEALKSGWPVLPLFIFDTFILEKLENLEDRRLTFLHQTLTELNETCAVGPRSRARVFLLNIF